MSEHPHILFRFHRDYEICRQNLALFKAFNPDCSVHGLYGGHDALEALPTELTELFTSCWKIPLDDPLYKWKNGDLCVRWWYKEQGHRFSFDHVILLEWDLLMAAPLATVFPLLEPDTNYATIFGDYAFAQEIKWHWLVGEAWECQQILKNISETIGRQVDLTQLQYGIMAAATFSWSFLEAYSAIPVASYSNDELRFSIYSEALGFPLRNTGLYTHDRCRITADDYAGFTSDYIAELLSIRKTVIHPQRHLLSQAALGNFTKR